MSAVVEKFLKYVTYDTMSNDDELNCPSSQGQRLFAEELVNELQEIGAKEITFDRAHCYIYATIPATVENAKTIGFISHIDTSPAVSGKNVKPRIITDYDGSDIILNSNGIKLDTVQYPELNKYIGKSLIVTDGTTLLGADDKAGVAEIIAMAEYLLKNPQIPHGKIRIAFTPDEEIGRGADFFDVEKFNADYAYTVDGGALGEIEYENFNAADARLIIHGKSVHPGDAKNKMLNAILLAQEFQDMLPLQENPMNTEMYEGFYHPDSIKGNVEEVIVDYIIREHDREKFEAKKKYFNEVAAFLNNKYKSSVFEVWMKDSYYNMKEIIMPHYHLIDNAKEAMEELGITPIVMPIRGGTDGARLSFMGLPCPNLCTGGHNFHGKYEYICIESMEKIVELLVLIAQKYGKEILL